MNTESASEDDELIALSANQPLDKLFAQFFADVEGELDAETLREYVRQAGSLLIPHFKKLQHITAATGKAYWRKRLKRVKRATVTKELAPLRRFLEWAKEEELIETVPVIPSPPKSAKGVACKQRRRGKPTELSPLEVQAIVAALPEYSVNKKGEKYAVRARFAFMAATGLRPATIDALETPTHYVPGSGELHIAEIDDKAGYDRDLPISAAAVQALDDALRDLEPGSRHEIFGKHDYRYQLTKAAKRVLPPDRAHTFCGYDLRHAAITHWSEASSNLAGVQFLAGHRNASTTAKYIHASRRAGEQVLATVAGSGDSGGDNAASCARETWQGNLDQPPKCSN